MTRDTIRKATQHGDNLFPSEMLRRQKIQSIDKSHRVPANGASPEIRRRAGLRVGPTLRPAFVPAVIEETRLCVVGVRVINVICLTTSSNAAGSSNNFAYCA